MAEADLMALMSGGQPSGDAAAPVGAPMSTPQANAGEQQAAMVDIAMAMDLMEKSLAAFGSESEEGKGLLGALSGLSKIFNAKRDSARELIPAEIQKLVGSLPQTSPPTPEMQGMAQGAAAPGMAQGAGQQPQQQMAA